MWFTPGSITQSELSPTARRSNRGFPRWIDMPNRCSNPSLRKSRNDMTDEYGHVSKTIPTLVCCSPPPKQQRCAACRSAPGGVGIPQAAFQLPSSSVAPNDGVHPNYKHGSKQGACHVVNGPSNDSAASYLVCNVVQHACVLPLIKNTDRHLKCFVG